jgi:hypothetical protein
MKYPIYLRVAKTGSRSGYKAAASTKPNNEPLNSGTYHTEWYPTVSFGVVLEIPDELFNQAARMIAELNVKMKDALVSSEFVVPEGIAIKDKKSSQIPATIRTT